MGITDERNCNCQADKTKKINNNQIKNSNQKGDKEVILFAPFKGKMKVLKKIKKRMGLGQYNTNIIFFFISLGYHIVYTHS